MEERDYEKICRAYADSRDLEFVTKNNENNSVVHGYFKNYDIAEKYDYGKNVTTKNLKTAIYDGYTENEIENVDFYEYDTWEDFYDEFVESKARDEILTCECWVDVDGSWLLNLKKIVLIKLKEKYIEELDNLGKELEYKRKELEVCAYGKRELLEVEELEDEVEYMFHILDNLDLVISAKDEFNKKGV